MSHLSLCLSEPVLLTVHTAVCSFSPITILLSSCRFNVCSSLYIYIHIYIVECEGMYVSMYVHIVECACKVNYSSFCWFAMLCLFNETCLYWVVTNDVVTCPGLFFWPFLIACWDSMWTQQHIDRSTSRIMSGGAGHYGCCYYLDMVQSFHCVFQRHLL